MIVYKGHPSSINLEKAIDDLLEKGESDLCPLPKEGEAAAKGSDDEEEPSAGEGFSGDAGAFVTKFKEKVNELIKDKSIVEGCSKLQRAFFVLEEKKSFDSAKSSLSTNLELHLVLVGCGSDKSIADKIKEATKELRETAGVKVNEQIM